MIDGVLYVSTPYNRLVALDAASGRQRWAFDPRAYEDGQPASGQGFVHRGVAAWRDGQTLRLFLNTRHRLLAIDAETGQLIPSFGERGSVDLSASLQWAIRRQHLAATSPPVVYRDLVIVGSGIGDRLMYKNDPPGDVRAYHARTGALVWTFRTIPQEGDYGHDTWEGEASRITGHTNVWAPMALDEARGLVYLPVSTPSNDYYGGRRLGNNLFAESLVCLDAATGVRRWHFQIAHHGLWDYDPPAAPILTTLTVRGRRIDAVVQLTKQGFTFVFDRVTGTPVWPIEERPVPQSDVPGERSAPTQPFPTAPPPFTAQGTSLADAFDLTPALKAEAEAALGKFRLGPLYTPPSLQGTLVRPGVWGGANWGGGAVVPGTGMLYLKTTGLAQVYRLERRDPSQPDPRPGEVDADYVNRGGAAFIRDGIPLIKPPYAHVVALNLSSGTVAWTVPFGDMPALRRALAGLGVTYDGPLGAQGPAGVLVTGGGLVFVGGGDEAVHALDTRNGQTLWTRPTPETTGTPMTYQLNGRQFLVIATGRQQQAELRAYALPVPRSR
jgi:quinoprotein glucose dehydrogenase